ncbi:hypothetical protein EON77_08940, partial [bacterium]
MRSVRRRPPWREAMSNPLLRSSLVAAVASVLAACAVGPDYHRPDVKVPDQFVSAETPRYATTATGDVERFWQVFADDTLSRLVGDALLANLDLRISLARLNEARALRGAARLDLGPVITAQTSYVDQLRSSSQTFGLPREFKNYDASFDAFWELDLFGRARRALEASNAQLDAAAADLAGVQVSIAAELSNTYFDLRGNQQRLAVARRNVDNQTETLGLTRARLEAGSGTELDTSRASAQLAQTRATIAPLEAAVARDIHRIGVLTGRQPTALRDGGLEG